MGFKEIIAEYDWELTAEKIYSRSAADVQRVLHKRTNRTWDDFLTLVSPAAAPYLEQIALLSQELTQQNFGKTVQMYIPMYLSNECQNICTYCGFSLDNPIQRLTLNDDQIIGEIEVIKSLGYDHILLVTGEANKTVGVDYLENALQLIRPYFSNISIEVQPLDQEGYERLKNAGLYSVLVYQETYHQDNYKTYHPKGRKSNFNYRLETPERLGKAGMHKIGLGVLLGLEDWRVDSAMCALHLEYMERHFWQSKYSISFPRLRPAVGCTPPNVEVSDKELIQLIGAYRIFSPKLELSLSTRESIPFRNNAFKLGITSMSADSKTDPGGYAHELEALEQFSIDDRRPTSEVATAIRSQGYEVVWKDWDRHI